MDTNEDNCISIKKIQVYLFNLDKDKVSFVKRILEDSLRLQIEVLSEET